MKKYIFGLGIIMISLIIVSIKPTYGLESMKQELNINSNDLLTYMKDNKIQNIKKICTTDYCNYLKSVNMEKAIEIFKKDYQSYLTSKTNEEVALSTILKGFPIISIEF